MMQPDASDVPRWAEDCPEDDIFVRVVEGTVSPEDARALELHLDRCPDCARVMAELALDEVSSKDTSDPGDSHGDNFRLIAGQQVGRYTILERLGEGGMGVVYSAYDSRLDRRVALKFMLGSGTPRERERLRVEARALAQLTHPNVLTVHDIAEYEGELFIAAQYVEGATVDRWLAQTRRSQDAILDVFIQAGEGLAAAHARDLVHRDVKPSNLLVGAGDRVFVADFGLALSVPRSTVAGSPGKEVLRATSRVGTPSYMAPEQLRGERVDARADQYSFCVALYEALLGEQPFAPDADRAQPPPGLRLLPRHVAQCVTRGLSERPGERYPSMNALLTDLRPRGRRWGVLGAALGAAGLVAVAGFYTTRTSPQEECVTSGLLAQTWGDASIATTRDALLQSPHGYATTTWKTLRRYLDQHAGEWEDQLRDACEARWKSHRESDLIFDRRMQCLRRSALSLEHALVMIREAGPARALQVVYALPRARTCADPEPSRNPNSADSAGHDTLRQRFDRAQLIAPAGRVAEADQELRALLAEVELTEDRVLVGKIRTVLASITAHTRPAEEGTRDLSEAVLSTERGGDDESIAKALLMLSTHYAISVGDIAQARETERRARAVIARAEATPVLEQHAASTAAILALSAGEFTAAIEAFETVLTLYDTAQPDEPVPNRFLAVANMSMALQSAGRVSEALHLLQTNIAAADRGLGPGHPAAVGLHVRLGQVLFTAGRARDARDHLNALRKVFEREGSMPTIRADALSVLARAHGALGDHDQAYEILKQVRELWAELHPPGHPNVLSTDVDLANNLQRRGDVEGSVVLGEQVVAALEAMDAAPPNLLATALAGLGQGYTTQRRWLEARSMLYKANAVARRAELGPDVQCEVELLLGHLAVAEGTQDAVSHYERARELFTVHTTPVVGAEVLFGLAKLRAEEPGQLVAALALAAEADVAISTDPSADAALLLEQIEAWRSGVGSP